MAKQKTVKYIWTGDKKRLIPCKNAELCKIRWGLDCPGKIDNKCCFNYLMKIRLMPSDIHKYLNKKD